ncbi:MAG TPA: PQQ-binding-like beta-propeller repeat protein [Planctomycetaceae bacterium]|nr:PQQ-binding-like beta-propeller repeat protein [Planctomycetaceae bacterium]
MRSFVCLLTLFAAAAQVSAENWPNWRGPLNNGISSEKNLPIEWGPDKNVAWKVELPGPAGATPVVWGDRIFLTTTVKDPAADPEKPMDALLMAFSSDGKKLWEKFLGRGSVKPRGDEGNNPAAPSPLTDGKHVWTMLGTGDLACFDFDGKEIWKTDIEERYGKFEIQFGYTSTPVLDGDKLIIQLIHGLWNGEPQPAWIVALDKNTGKEIWKHYRKSDAFDENVHSYASPVIYQDEQQKFLLAHGADYVTAHDLETGEEMWRCGGLNPKDNYNRFLRLVASPSFNEGIIVVPSAKNGPILGLKPNGQGDITNDKSAQHWIRPRDTSDVPSPVIIDGIVYMVKENGVLIAMDAESGEQFYMERIQDGRHRASPVYADGHIYMTGREGQTSVIKVGKELEIVARNTFGELQTASPVISNGTIYMRTFNSLWAVRK